QRQGIEIFVSFANASKNLFQPMASAGSDDAIDQQKKNERRPHYREAEDQCSHTENSQTQRPPAAIIQATFFARPGDQRFRLGCDALTFTAHSKVFSKVKPRLQFGYRSLALLDFLNIGMSQQPPSQTPLAHFGARRREQLEQAAFAQNVQVFSVQVQRVLKFLTRF